MKNFKRVKIHVKDNPPGTDDVMLDHSSTRSPSRVEIKFYGSIIKFPPPPPENFETVEPVGSLWLNMFQLCP